MDNLLSVEPGLFIQIAKNLIGCDDAIYNLTLVSSIWHKLVMRILKALANEIPGILYVNNVLSLSNACVLCTQIHLIICHKINGSFMQNPKMCDNCLFKSPQLLEEYCINGSYISTYSEYYNTYCNFRPSFTKIVGKKYKYYFGGVFRNNGVIYDDYLYITRIPL